VRIVDARREGSGVEARVRLDGGRSFAVRYRLPDPSLPLAPESLGSALVAALLPFAMLSGEGIVSDLPASPRLLAALDGIQRFYLRCRRPWKVPLRRVGVSCPAVETRGGGGTLLFATLGVDSTHTLLARGREITHLLFVEGFDVERRDRARLARVREGLERLADLSGKRLLVAASDLREGPLAAVPWEIAFGAALASVALLLHAVASRALLSASFYPGFAPPWGSHPDLDPLFSTEGLALEHEGFRLHRAQKVEALARHPALLASLRVCWKNEPGLDNCSRCEKCLRTMAKLLAYGALDACPTFGPLDPGAVAALDIPRHLRFSWKINLRELRRKGGHEEVCAAIETALARGSWIRRLLR
jgi:hypothetical protein